MAVKLPPLQNHYEAIQREMDEQQYRRYHERLTIAFISLSSSEAALQDIKQYLTANGGHQGLALLAINDHIKAIQDIKADLIPQKKNKSQKH